MLVTNTAESGPQHDIPSFNYVQGCYVQNMPPVYGQQPIPFGSMPPTMQPAGTYYSPVPAAPFMPDPSQHTLHANAPQFVSLW